MLEVMKSVAVSLVLRKMTGLTQDKLADKILPKEINQFFLEVCFGRHDWLGHKEQYRLGQTSPNKNTSVALTQGQRNIYLSYYFFLYFRE